MKQRLTLTVATLIVAIFAFGPILAVSAATVAPPNPLKNIAVTGTNITNGLLSINSFAVKGGEIVANGTLTGTVNGQAVTQAVQIPVNIVGGTCTILTLQLGPIDLNLLGLRVQVSQINVNITAEPGPGNLLGNLLCQLADILNGQGRAVGRIVNLLNQILSALG